MANNFTVEKQRRLGGPQGKSFIVVEGILVIDTTSLGGANALDLVAALFKLKKIISCIALTNSANTTVFFASPDYTGDSLLVGGGAAFATADLPNDTYRIKLLGT